MCFQLWEFPVIFISANKDDTLSSLLALNSLTVSLQTLPPYLCVVILLSDLTLKSEAGEQLCLVAAEAPD